MSTRTVASALVVLTILAGCSSPEEPDAAPPSAGVPAPASSAPASPSGPAPGSAPAEATEPAAGKAPSRAFTVGTRRLSLTRDGNRPLPTTVWFPEGQGRFPLIVFSHGFRGLPADYAKLTTAWARAGFVVAAPAYPNTSRGAAQFNPVDVLNQPDDASFVITRVLAEMRDRVDPERIAAGGHSGGGVTTLGLFTANRDDRLDAGLVLAGRQIVPTPFAGPPAPMLYVHGQRDQTVAFADGKAAYDATPWPKALVSVTAGGHLSTGAELDMVAVTTTDFWRYALYGDRAARDRLKSDATRGGRATFTNDLS